MKRYAVLLALVAHIGQVTRVEVLSTTKAAAGKMGELLASHCNGV